MAPIGVALIGRGETQNLWQVPEVTQLTLSNMPGNFIRDQHLVSCHSKARTCGCDQSRPKLGCSSQILTMWVASSRGYWLPHPLSGIFPVQEIRWCCYEREEHWGDQHLFGRPRKRMGLWGATGQEWCWSGVDCVSFIFYSHTRLLTFTMKGSLFMFSLTTSRRLYLPENILFRKGL